MSVESMLLTDTAADASALPLRGIGGDSADGRYEVWLKGQMGAAGLPGWAASPEGTARVSKSRTLGFGDGRFPPSDCWRWRLPPLARDAVELADTLTAWHGITGEIEKSSDDSGGECAPKALGEPGGLERTEGAGVE